MPVIFQPVRVILREQVKKYAHYVTGRVLDVGAGDFSRYQDLFNCQEYVKMDVTKNENVEVIGRAEEIPFADASFDSAVCTEVFEHLADPYRAAKEIYRILKPGGHCLMTVPQTVELHEEPHDYFRYTKFGLAKIFTSAGFKIIASEQRGGFFTLLTQIAIRYLIDHFKLYQHNWSRLLNPFFKITWRLTRFLDRIDKSRANRKNTLGWCLVLEK